jgi:hypothetical protein
MSLKPTSVHAFNTKRQYTANGQRIAWTLLSTGNIAMVDIDRGIDYILVRAGTGLPLTNSTVLALYDGNKTQRVWNRTEYDEAYAARATLEAAAATL